MSSENLVESSGQEIISHLGQSDARNPFTSEEEGLLLVARRNNGSMEPHGIEPLGSGDRLTMVTVFSMLTVISFLGNIVLLCRILRRRLFKSFISNHFIGHLTLVNLLSCAYLLPVFLKNLSDGGVINGTAPVHINFFCRFHAFAQCTIWTVTHYMVTCIAGVHLLTFARIHYEQLFGLSPNIICALSWVIGAALGLPCITNTDLVGYNQNLYHCMWVSGKKTSYHFLAYMLLLGLMLPVSLTFYAYGKILTIFYHSPIVFEALGIFRARYLIFAFLLNSLIQVPFYVVTLLDPMTFAAPALVLPVVAFLAYSISLNHFVLYGTSLFIMQEDDMTLAHKAQKHTYTPAGVHTPRV